MKPEKPGRIRRCVSFTQKQATAQGGSERKEVDYDESLAKSRSGMENGNSFSGP